MCEAITARRRRELPGGTVGGRIAWAKTPRASAPSQTRTVMAASPMTSGTICVADTGAGTPARVS